MDSVANMLVTIKNGYMASKNKVEIPYSRFKYEIAKVLEKENWVSKVEKEDLKILIELSYQNKKPKITEIKKVSKLGVRIYTKSKDIKPVKGGKGSVVISTPQGVMSGKEARGKNLGGEVICKVW